MVLGFTLGTFFVFPEVRSINCKKTEKKEKEK